MNSVIKKIKSLFKRKNSTSKDFVSRIYWDQRYRKRQNSGSGSYGRLALFKANFINDFVRKHNISTVIDMGCGDGNQLTLAQYPKYIGFDVSKKAISICRQKFKGDKTKTFINASKLVDDNKYNGDLVLSLDVIYHLIEDEVFMNYMNTLFSLSNNYVIIYSSNYEERIAEHVKCRKFTLWVENNIQDFELIEMVPNEFPFDEALPATTSMSDFYIYKKIA